MSTANVLTQEMAVALVNRFAEVMADGTLKCSQVCPLIGSQGSGTLKMQTRAVGGPLTTMAVTDVSLTLLPVSSGYVSLNTATVYKAVGLNVAEADLQGITPASVGEGLARSVMAGLDKLFFDGLEALFSTNHPMTGTGASEVGSSKKYIDTSLAYLQTESGAGTQDTLLTSALSASSFALARKMISTQRNYRGDFLAAPSRLVLVCDYANDEVARQILGSSVTDLNQQVNVNQGTASLVEYTLTTDSDDWWLVDPDKAPVGLWIERAPTLGIVETHPGIYEVSVSAAAKFAYDAAGYGIIGSNMA